MKLIFQIGQVLKTSVVTKESTCMKTYEMQVTW